MEGVGIGAQRRVPSMHQALIKKKKKSKVEIVPADTDYNLLGRSRTSMALTVT